MKVHGVVRRLRRLCERMARQHPRVFGDAALGGQRFGAADGHAPQAAVDRIGRAVRRHRQLARLQVFELFRALESLIAHGCKHFQVGRQGAQRHFKAHLVVAGRGATVGDHVGAQFARNAGDGLSLHGALCTHAQRVHLTATHIAHDQEAQHLLKVIGAGVDLVMGNGTQCQRTLMQRFGCRCIDAAGVDRDGDDRPAGVFGHPGHEKRGVEAARIGEDDGLYALR